MANKEINYFDLWEMRKAIEQGLVLIATNEKNKELTSIELEKYKLIVKSNIDALLPVLENNLDKLVNHKIDGVSIDEHNRSVVVLQKLIRMMYLIIESIHTDYLKTVLNDIETSDNSLYNAQRIYDKLVKYRNDDQYILKHLSEENSVSYKIQTIIKMLRKILDSGIEKLKRF